MIIRSSAIRLRAISHEILHPTITNDCLKIMCLQFYSNLPGASEFRSPVYSNNSLKHNDSEKYRLPLQFYSNLPGASELRSRVYSNNSLKNNNLKNSVCLAAAILINGLCVLVNNDSIGLQSDYLASIDTWLSWIAWICSPLLTRTHGNNPGSTIFVSTRPTPFRLQFIT